MNVGGGFRTAVVTVVSAMYNVAEYVDDFFRTLDAQTVPAWMVKVVLVNDGSTDHTLALARKWAETTSYDVTIIDQLNAGVAAARNAGFARVETPWVLFPDPDDEIADDYIARLFAAAVDGSAASPEMVVARVTGFRDLSSAGVGCALEAEDAAESTLHSEGGRLFHGHATDWRFQQAQGPAIVDMRQNPAALQMFTHSVLFSTAALRAVSEEGAAPFDPRIRPTFEDAELVLRLLQRMPTMVLAPQARYYYRKRNDNSSLVGSAWLNPQRYDDIFRFGYLPLLERTAGTPLEDAARYLVHYEIGWYDHNLHATACSVLEDQRLAESFEGYMTRAINMVGSVMGRGHWWHFAPGRSQAWALWAETPVGERARLSVPAGADIPGGQDSAVMTLPLDVRCFGDGYVPPESEPAVPNLRFEPIAQGIGRRLAMRGHWAVLAALMVGGRYGRVSARLINVFFSCIKRG